MGVPTEIAVERRAQEAQLRVIDIAELDAGNVKQLFFNKIDYDIGVGARKKLRVSR